VVAADDRALDGIEPRLKLEAAVRVSTDPDARVVVKKEA